jgi:hypothetical protein
LSLAKKRVDFFAAGILQYSAVGPKNPLAAWVLPRYNWAGARLAELVAAFHF